MINSVSLFADPASHDGVIRQLLVDAIRRSPKSREEIVEEMTRMLGRKITTSMLNACTAPGRECSRFPACWVWSFCKVLGDDHLQRFLLGPELLSMLQLGEADAHLLERNREQPVRRLIEDSAPARRNGNGSCAR
jgi:hypothetical protein